MNFFAELKRRNVIRVALAYLLIAWLILQVGDTLAPALRLGEWVNSALAFFLILGFPLALFFAWMFEMTPEGLKFERDVDRGSSKTAHTGKKVDRLIIVVLAIAVAYFAIDKFVFAPATEDEPAPPEGAAVADEPSVRDQSIAVLPFADMSPEGDQEYFSDGIAEEILNVLVRVDDLSVASRTSSFGFKGQEALGIPAIADKLKVRHVLEGSVRKAGDTVRITAQLIDAQTDQHLWSETYDRELTAENIFAIQDEIAHAIVAELGVLVEDQPIAAGTDNLDAYDLFLKAHKAFIERSNPVDITNAIELFEMTVAADRQFGRAVAGLAAAYAIAPSWGYEERDYFALATEAAEKAIALDPGLPMSYTVLGYVAMEQRRFEDSASWFDKSMSVDDMQPTLWLWRGILNNALGYFDLARRALDRCLELDPAYVNCIRHRARNALYSGNIDESLELIERAWLQGFGSANPMFLKAYAARGNHAVVLATLSASYSLVGQGPLVSYVYRAITDPDFSFAEERAEIEAVHKALTGSELDWGGEDAVDALVFRAYGALSADLSQQAWWHPYPTDFFDSPHRKRIMREAGLPDHWRKHGFPAHCRPLGQDDFECDRLVSTADSTRRSRVSAPN